MRRCRRMLAFNVCGFSTVVPSLSVAMRLTPRSTPIWPCNVVDGCGSGTSTSRLAYQRPLCLLMVMRDGWMPPVSFPTFSMQCTRPMRGSFNP